jgi:hypothetical protein
MKMGGDNNVHIKQWYITEFLNAESTVFIEIRCFKNVYGDMAVDVGTVKECVRHVSDGGCGLKDMPKSGCPHTTAMVENEESGSTGAVKRDHG